MNQMNKMRESVQTEEEKLEQTRAFFRNDRFATANGAEIEAIGTAYARCTMELTKEHKNAAGGIMGGAIFTLADFAFAVAANWEELGTVSLSSNISFLNSVKGNRLIAEASCIKMARSVCYYEIRISDELGTQVASVTAAGYRRQGQ